ncbi:hypothetical protein EHM69_00365 [candidate division KSB1 bacterium]|nr:MAG: hypothetical protein EHM69_00365 [candidate division KSB1 bacterium]
MHGGFDSSAWEALPIPEPERAASFLQLTRSILGCAGRGVPRAAFLREVSAMLLDFSGCDYLDIRHRDGDTIYRWSASRRSYILPRFELFSPSEDIVTTLGLPHGTALGNVARMVLTRTYPGGLDCFTSGGSFWLNDTSETPQFLGLHPGLTQCIDLEGAEPCRSLLLIPFAISGGNAGFVLLASERTEHFDAADILLFETIAQTFGFAAADRRAQEALRERVKELTCLYGMMQIADSAEWTREEKLERIVHLLPLAWQHPEIAAAKIELDGTAFQTPNWREEGKSQRADVMVDGRKRGCVEVVYITGELEFAGNPFLDEEACLIVEVARQIAGIIEREETEALRRREQLWHADRLATIGKLSSSIAHELNEPLSSILGFAQLAKKSVLDPARVTSDLDKIVSISLHAREIVRKLLIFARQMPAKKSLVQINHVVQDALSLVETRCGNEGIELALQLKPDLPEIEADPSQLNQVIVNLVVNAMQAMPRGGQLTIQTARETDALLLIVEDTGIGMDPDVSRQIFHPFFTTKDVLQGTGLGLSVVHGIVTSHGGTIQVQSSPGAGSRFEVRLPLSGGNSEKKG